MKGAMDHITYLFKSQRPASSEKLPSGASEAQSHHWSWGSKVLSKVKECHGAIRRMITFEKIQRTTRSDFLVTPRKIVSAISLPDIITSANTSDEVTEEVTDEESPLTRSVDLNTIKNPRFQRRKINVLHLSNSFMSADDDMSDSLKSFLALEKQVEEEIEDCHSQEEKEDECESDVKRKNEKSNPMKISRRKKLSAEPFISSLKNESFWADCEDESLETSDFSFCEREHKCTSSPIRDSTLRDSGFESHSFRESSVEVTSSSHSNSLM